jgi:hypothetical protein
VDETFLNTEKDKIQSYITPKGECPFAWCIILRFDIALKKQQHGMMNIRIIPNTKEILGLATFIQAKST